MATTVLNPTATFSDIWRLAIQEYETEVGIDASRLQSIATASSTVEEIVIEIGQSQVQFETYRKKGEKLRKALKPMINSVGELADALGDGVSVVFPPGKAIFTALKVMVEASKGVSETYDAIMEIFGSLNLFLGRLSIYIQHDLTPLLKEVIVKILAQILLTLGKVTNLIKEKRSVAFVKQLIGKNSKVQETLSKLEKFMAQEGQAVAVATFSATNQILELLQGQMSQIIDDNKELKLATDDMLNTILKEAGKLHDSSQKAHLMLEEIKGYVMIGIYGKDAIEKRDRIVKWLYSKSTDHHTIYSQIFNAHVEGTGEWFLNHSDFKNWADGDVKYLECQGIAGAGKSVLAAIAYHTLKHRPEQAFIPLLHIHLQYDSAKQQDMSSLFCGLLSQLVQFTPNISASVLQLYSTYQDSSPPLREILEIMRLETSRYLKVLIIVDALDELSAAQDGTEDTFVEYLQSLGPTAHIMITSRNKVPFLLQTSSAERSIKIMANADDIQTYIKKRINSGPLSRFMTDSLRKDLLQTITEKSEGMFLVAQLQMALLATKLNPRSVRQALQELPPGLKGAYEATMERIRAAGEEAYHIAMQVFKWLVFSKRQLSLLEIQHALAVEGQLSNWEELQENITPMANIVSVCAGLVMEDTVQLVHLLLLGGDQWQNHSSIRFIHASANEYFRDIFLTLGPGPERQMTEACLHYISQAISSSGLMEYTKVHHSEISRLHRLHPLLSYAFLHWGSHAHAIQGNFNHDLLDTLAYNDNVVQLLLEGHRSHLQLRSNGGVDSNSSVSFPLILIYFDLSGLLASRFDRASLVNEERGNKITYLMYAAGWGQSSTTTWLIGADSADALLQTESDTNSVKMAYINTQNSTGRTAISYASGNKHLEIMKLLLVHQADFTLMDEQGLTPLAYAAKNGHTEAVKLLLDAAIKHGNDIQLTDTNGRTPLSYAAGAYNGEEAVKLLIKGIDVNLADSDGCTAISYAASAGNADAVRFLSENGADFTLTDSQGRMPLSYAAGAYRNSEEVMKLLIQNIDINFVDADGRTPIFYAAKAGNADAVIFLLEHGANCNMKDSKCRTAISYAAGASRNGAEIMRLFIQDTDVNLVDSNGCTPIFYAARLRTTDEVRLLIEHGADLDLKDDTACTPFLHAAQAGNGREVMDLLFLKDTNINLVDSDGCTAIDYAVKNADTDAVKFLLEHGAVSELKDSKGRLGNALISYVTEFDGNDEVIKLLMKDIDVNLVDPYGRTAVSYAAEACNTDSVRFLIGHGADLSLRDSEGRTALSYIAGAHNGEEIMNLLFEDNIDVNVVDSDGRTAISYAAEQGNTDVVRFLLEHGADYRLKDQKGRTPLLYAAAANTEDVIILLIKDIDVNMLDSDGRSAISYAAGAGNTNTVRLLLNHGADARVIDYRGCTPLSYAAKSCTEDAIKLLIKDIDVNVADLDGCTPIFYAARVGNINAIRFLLEHGADFRLKDSQGRTPLSYAAEAYRNTEEVMKLLIHNIDINLVDADGCTPIFYAARAGNVGTAKFLIAHGADLKVKDSKGCTPLSYAAGADVNNQEQLELIKLFIKYIDVNHADSDGCTPIFYATNIGNIGTVRLLVEHGADVKLKDSQNQTLLSYAARANENGEEIMRLIIKDIDVNLVDSDGWTPIFYASEIGNMDAVVILLKHGADVELKDKQGRKPLSYAAGADVQLTKSQRLTSLSYATAVVRNNERLLKVLELLIRDNDINLVDVDGCTPIFYAAEVGNTGAVRLLLEHGADPKLKDNQDQPLLSYAARAYQNSEEVMALIIQDIDVNFVDSDEWTPIFYAADVENVDAVVFLLEHGADSRLKNSQGRTPLSYAAGADRSNKILLKLLLQDVDVNLVDTDGCTPIFYAAKAGNISAVRFLLENGADFRLKESKGRTVLSYAAGAIKNSKEVMELLIKDIDLDLMDLDGRTAISYAAETGCTSAIELLLNHGAKCDAKDKNNRSNVSYAAASANPQAMHLLIQNGADIRPMDVNGHSALSYAAQTNCISAVKHLLDQGMDPNFVSEEGRTLLSYAAGSLHGLETMGLFIRMGMNVNSVDSRHRAPISYAAELSEGTRSVKILLQSGALFDHPDSDGRTPLSYAAVNRNQYIEVYLQEMYLREVEDVTLVKLLLDQGALVDSLSTSGRTPLSFAAEAWRPKTVQFFLKQGADANCLDNEGRNPLWHAMSTSGLRGERSRKDCDETLSFLRHAGAVEPAVPIFFGPDIYSPW